MGDPYTAKDSWTMHRIDHGLSPCSLRRSWPRSDIQKTYHCTRSKACKHVEVGEVKESLAPSPLSWYFVFLQLCKKKNKVVRNLWDLKCKHWTHSNDLTCAILVGMTGTTAYPMLFMPVTWPWTFSSFRWPHKRFFFIETLQNVKMLRPKGQKPHINIHCVHT